MACAVGIRRPGDIQDLQTTRRGRRVVGAARYFIKMLGRLRSSVLAPMPLILRRSSALLNEPFFSRYATIACALLKPMPCNSLAMVAASAELISTGPAHAPLANMAGSRLQINSCTPRRE